MTHTHVLYREVFREVVAKDTIKVFSYACNSFVSMYIANRRCHYVMNNLPYKKQITVHVRRENDNLLSV